MVLSRDIFNQFEHRWRQIGRKRFRFSKEPIDNYLFRATSMFILTSPELGSPDKVPEMTWTLWAKACFESHFRRSYALFGIRLNTLSTTTRGLTRTKS